MSAPIDTLLSRLDGVRPSKANSWMARCPAHNGDGRSLAVTHSEDGRILIYCFAHQCDVDDILGAVGMSVSDLFPDRLPEHRYQPRKHGVSGIDVMRAMRSELEILHLLADEMSRGELVPAAYERAQLSAERIRKALYLCDG